MRTGCSNFSNFNRRARFRFRRELGDVIGRCIRLDGVHGALLLQLEEIDMPSLSSLSKRPSSSKSFFSSTPSSSLSSGVEFLLFGATTVVATVGGEGIFEDDIFAADDDGDGDDPDDDVESDGDNDGGDEEDCDASTALFNEDDAVPLATSAQAIGGFVLLFMIDGASGAPAEPCRSIRTTFCSALSPCWDSGNIAQSTPSSDTKDEMGSSIRGR